MRILFICHRHPYPPKRGGKIRPFNIVRHFTDAGHEVHVGSLTRSDVEVAEGKDLEKYCASTFSAPVTKGMQALKMVMNLPSTRPSSMGYFHASSLHDHVSRLLAEKSFDLIFTHCSSVAQYSENVSGIKKVLDFGDMDSQKWLEYAKYKPFPLSAGYYIEGSKLMRAEARLAGKFDLCTATTFGELETLQHLAPGRPASWFPNGVDAEYFSVNESYDPNSISFIGRMDYFPNQEAVLRFCNKVLPIIQESLPDAKFSIVGAEPSAEIQALSRLKGVEVTGTVPDVRPFVQRSAVMVAPLSIARGTQNKILEAMAMGIPVVSSSQAAKGVDALKDEHILVSDDDKEFAELVVRMMRDRDQRRKIGLAGRERVLHAHNWSNSMTKLDTILVSHGCLPATRESAELAR